MAPDASSERKQQAKESRTSGRARRGGALLGKGEAKLNRPELIRKGYKRRWFKDEGGRIQAAIGNDWDKVEDVERVRSGTNRDGSPRWMILMEKREDWYREDQLKKREKDIQKETLLKQGKVVGGEYQQAARDLSIYTPSEGVTIKNDVIKT
jgi:hypothetical protein